MRAVLKLPEKIGDQIRGDPMIHLGVNSGSRFLIGGAKMLISVANHIMPQTRPANSYPADRS